MKRWLAAFALCNSVDACKWDRQCRISAMPLLRGRGPLGPGPVVTAFGVSAEGCSSRTARLRQSRRAAFRRHTLLVGMIMRIPIVYRKPGVSNSGTMYHRVIPFPGPERHLQKAGLSNSSRRKKSAAEHPKQLGVDDNAHGKSWVSAAPRSRSGGATLRDVRTHHSCGKVSAFRTGIHEPHSQVHANYRI